MNLDEQAVEALLEKSEHQQAVIVGLYKMVFPNWGSHQEDRWLPQS
jgi:hypothetical protein